MRNLLLTLAVIAAVVAVWGVALVFMDRSPSVPGRFGASPTARIERRPAIFVVHCRVAETRGGGDGTLMGEATPVALVEPSGELRPPIPEGGAGSRAAFRDAYYTPNASIRLLAGGAEMGRLVVDRALSVDEGDLVGRGACSGSGGSTLAGGPPIRVMLGVSDQRVGALESAQRPMRASHREAAARLLKSEATARVPTARLDDLSALRVRVTDLNHDGRPELVVTGLVAGRDADGRSVRLHGLLIAEPGPGEGSYQPAYTCLEPDAGDAGHCEYIDQIDVSPAEYDEVVLDIGQGAERTYAVLRRDGDGWREVFRGTAR